jgi:lysozyme
MIEGAVLPKGEWSYGMDISHHQPIIRWNKLKILVDEEGRSVWKECDAVRVERIDYVFMKATEGESFKDWRFKGRWKKAKRAGVTRGAYHFFRPGKNAVEQAKSFIKRVVELEEGDLPPVLDIEKLDGCSKETLNKRALQWLQIVEKYYGRKPIVYANPYYLNNIIDPRISQNYPIWVANYKVSRPSVGRWQYWQFTDRALVRGAGCVDLNVKRK